MLVDNGSSYIEELCESVGEYDLKRYDEVDSLDYDAVILSGRVRNDKTMNVKNIEIVRRCYDMKIPLLGICYGAEITALALGGTIRRLDEKVYGMRSIYMLRNGLLDREEMRVFENHQYSISRIPPNFRSIAYSSTNKNEIITNSIIYATQFHPEMSDDGRALIKRFIDLSRYVSNQL